MNKNFNSFQQIIQSLGGSSNGFRSFGDWAKNELGPKPEPQEEQQPEPSEEQEELNEQVSVENSEETNPVSNLLEKLSDFDWEESQPVQEEKESETGFEEVRKRLEERKKSKEKIREVKESHREKIEEDFREEPTKAYRVFKDRDENFECQIQVEGTSLSDAKVRIVLESDSWNFVFYGNVYGDGKCVVPIKKGIPLVEGATGNIKLEVIAEDQLFIGWEDTFKVSTSKKVKVALKEQKSVRVTFNNSLNEDRE